MAKHVRKRCRCVADILCPRVKSRRLQLPYAPCSLTQRLVPLPEPVGICFSDAHNVTPTQR